MDASKENMQTKANILFYIAKTQPTRENLTKAREACEAVNMTLEVSQLDEMLKAYEA